MAIQVEIVTPGKVVFSGEASEVNAPGFHGEFGVLPEHAPFLSVVKPGVVRVRTAKGEQVYVVGRGFVEAGPDQLTLLTDSFQEAGAVDKAQAEKDLVESEQVLASTDPASPEWANAEIKAELARARLSV